MFGVSAVTCHYLYVRRLWQIASSLGLRARRYIPNTKKIIDKLKTLPFETAKALEGKFDRIRRDCDGLTYVNPKYLDFFHSFQKLFLFNNEKNEEFDVYPIRVWNMSDYATYARKQNPK